MKVETRVGIFVIVAIGIFFYLSLNIKAIRLDQGQYYSYKTYFDDTGGLDEKSSVKIAGVEVGWVEKINLLEGGKAEVILMVHRRNKLARNAYATVQQEGLIGTKYTAIEPGDPTTGLLPPGSVLAMPGRPPTSVGDLLDQFKDIATGVQSVVDSFRNTFGTHQGEENLKVALNSVALASQRVANFSQVLERTLERNEQNINTMLENFKKTSGHLDEAIPAIKNDFEKVTLALADDTLPHIADASKKAGTAFKSVGDTAENMKGTFKEAEEIATKINEGQGILGKLINEDEIYGDLKKTVRGFKETVEKAKTLDIQIDMHSESLLKHRRSKGYFEAKLRPYEDYFYNIQLVSDEHGRIVKQDHYYNRYDRHGNLLDTDTIETNYGKIDLPDREEVITQTKNDFLFGFQFGKRFDRLALRVGLFESTFGIGCDYYVPLQTNKIHWVTSLEAFDFNGANRIYSRRPHVKWLNRLFFMKNIYTTFGVDDVCSKNEATPFFGGGIRFGDEDIKYLLSYLPTKGVAS